MKPTALAATWDKTKFSSELESIHMSMPRNDAARSCRGSNSQESLKVSRNDAGAVEAPIPRIVQVRRT